MALRFFLESDSNQPEDSGLLRIYVDGTSKTLREGKDIELSHWNPNTTEDRFAADSSTEIVLNFLRLEGPPTDGLVINNHLDVDGILAAWCLIQPELALKHRELLVQMAEIGDFWAWADGHALLAYQNLVDLLLKGKAEQKAEEELYQACFERIPALLETCPDDDELEMLDRSLARLEEGLVHRDLMHQRFVAYRIPASVHEGDLEAALKVDNFNPSLRNNAILPPVLRNRLDASRVQLVSTEGSKGWYHDLFYPGYMWAETVDRWRAPGFWEGENSNTWYFRFAPLEEALQELNRREQAAGQWISAEELTPFDSVLGRSFPVVASFLGEDDQPAVSSLSPHEVSELLSRVFTYNHTSTR